MRILLAVGLAVLLLASGAGAKQTNKPDLKLMVSIDTAAPEQQPILVIHMVNQSGHLLRIPDPPLLCKSAPGAFSLDVKFVPENSNQPQPAIDCGLDLLNPVHVWSVAPSALIHWRRLLLELHRHQLRDPRFLHRDTIERLRRLHGPLGVRDHDELCL